ncbi:hypothetical protein OPV22_016016 [Ensete ventricosum]|uniref:Uncharacterized protein n=1 Tax=Ensete ventricosum TaxID=4639 RepID=A0AAV8R551_ENSVE|nr:hypothetical protein OPV22_016016 [Ensete ventricosum]
MTIEQYLAFRCNLDADMCFSLDFPKGHLKTTGPVDSFRPKSNSQHDDKELGVDESFCGSTLCSGCNQTEATHSEMNAAQQPFQAEQSILFNTSGDGECVQSGDIDVRPNGPESKEQASTKLSSMDFLFDLSHSSGATKAMYDELDLADDIFHHPASSPGPVDSFRPRANSQHDDKELGVDESFCASTLCSCCNQAEATHSEINVAQQPLQAEQ